MKSKNAPIHHKQFTVLKSGATISNKRLDAYRSDGWTNILTGLGLGNDKKIAGNLAYVRLTEVDCETLYAGDDISARICDLLPQNAVRKWVDYQGLDEETEVEFMEKIAAIELKKKALQGLTWGALYGGAGALIGTSNQDEDLTQPLNEDAIEDISSITILTRYELYPSQLQYNPLAKNFGYPEFYRMQLRGASPINGSEVHHSRIIRFEGVELPRRLHIQNQYWGDSKLSRVYEVIRNFNTAHSSLATVLQDFRVGIFKLKNLAEMVAMGEDGAIQKRIALVDAAKSVSRSVVIDAEGEDFRQETGTLTGLQDAYNIINERLVAATGIPITVLLGKSPVGMGQSGRHEETNWYDMVAAYQEDTCRPIFKRIFELVLKSKDGPTQGKLDPGFGFTFNPLWQLDEKEQTEMRYTQAQADQIYMTTGSVTPEEIAISRFGGEKWDGKTKIDLDMRKQIDSQAQQTSAGEGPVGSGKPVNPDKNILDTPKHVPAIDLTSSGQIDPDSGPAATLNSRMPNDDSDDDDLESENNYDRENSDVVKGNLNPAGATVSGADPVDIAGVTPEERETPAPTGDHSDPAQTIIVSKSVAKSSKVARQMAQQHTGGQEIQDADESSTGYRFHMRAPGDFQPGTTKIHQPKETPGISVVRGKLKK